MQLDGYSVIDITPFEAASGAQAVQATGPGRRGAASFRFDGKSGWHDLAVQYFDENDGAAQFKVFVGAQPLDAWTASDSLPSKLPDSHTSTRRLIRGVALRPGDVIRVEGTADEGENAVLDYVEIRPVAD